MEKPWKKKEIILASVIVIFVAVVISAFAYSYFSVNIAGNNDATSTTAKMGKIDIDFVADSYFNNDNMFLIKDSDREKLAESISFSIKNSTEATIPSKYNIFLTDILITNNFKSKDFKWELLLNNSVVSTGNFLSIGNNTEMKLNGNVINLPFNQTDSYVLRAWLSESDEDQLSLLSGSFSAKLKVEATNQ